MILLYIGLIIWGVVSALALFGFEMTGATTKLLYGIAYVAIILGSLVALFGTNFL